MAVTNPPAAPTAVAIRPTAVAEGAAYSRTVIAYDALVGWGRGRAESGRFTGTSCQAALMNLIGEQIAYYRARAPEYEQGAYPVSASLMRPVIEAVPAGRDALELACGTGVWTQLLAARSRTLTAVDAAPEMIELARSRAPAATFVVADILGWRPPRRYDVVFFGFWLSHVPESGFTDFWTLVADCLVDGGKVVFVDEHVAGAGKERWLADGVVERTLSDGSTHRVVKRYVDPERLVPLLAELGWHADVARLGPDWVLGQAVQLGSRPR
jgi:SAM-dependent methyltransferase